jgi:hypothetical protein
MTDKHLITIRDAELLGASVAGFHGRPRVVLAVRLDPANSFKHVNLGISTQQASRLLQDLKFLFSNSGSLKDVSPLDPSAKEAYLTIMHDRPRPPTTPPHDETGGAR